MLLKLNSDYVESSKAINDLLEKSNTIYSSALTAKSMFGVYEDYSFKLKNHVSITVSLHEIETGVFLTIVVSGGGKGILNFNYGHYKSLEEDILKWLDLYNIEYEEVE